MSAGKGLIGRKSTFSGLARKEERSFYLFVLPWILGFILFTAWPMIYSVYLSFMKWDFIGSQKFIGWENYEKLFNDKNIIRSLKVTFTYVFTSVPLGMVVAFLLALLLNQNVASVKKK